MAQVFLLVLAMFLWSTLFAAEPGSRHDIEIVSDVPSVAVAPRQPGRFTMRLPGLTYALTVTASCSDDSEPDSVSINVADSRMSFSAAELQAGESLQFELQIPSNQIGPLRLEQFCVESEQKNTAVPDKITIPSVLSAQVSLRCATESAASIRYLTVPLDVSLECVLPEPIAK